MGVATVLGRQNVLTGPSPLATHPSLGFLTATTTVANSNEEEHRVDNQLGRPLEVEVRDNLEKAMKILKQKMSKEGILQEIKRRRFYEKPSVKRKRKMREARKRRRREAKRRGEP